MFKSNKLQYLFQTYTVNSESIYLLIFGVPKINLRPELKNLCQKYGEIKNLTYCDEYPTEDFTECFRVKYEQMQSARIAKRMIDTKNFFGGSLHVCYAPEFETLDETRAKLTQRRIDVAKRLKINKLDESARNHVNVAGNNASFVEGDVNKGILGFNVNTEGLVRLRSGLCVNNDSTYTSSGLNVNNYGFFGAACGLNTGLNVSNESIIHSTSGLNVNNDNLVSPNTNNGDSVPSGSGFNANLDVNVVKKAVVKPEYVFKHKIKRRSKNLDREIQKIKMSVREIGPVLSVQGANKKDIEAVNGRIVVCERIETPRIVKIKSKPMNKIVFNINNTKL